MRLFFALWPPQRAVEKLAEQAALLARRHGGRATRQETIHLTLAFLGEVEETSLDAVVQAACAVRAEPFTLAIDRLGYWRHNRLFWASCLSPAEELRVLAESLRKNLHAASIACDESHGFVPHLTLVRKVRDAAATNGVQAFEPVSWTCEGFALVHSQQNQTGPAYRNLAEFRFEPRRSP